MKRIIITSLSLYALVISTFAQVRQFHFQGNTISVDISTTIDEYYAEALNGSWNCIPVVIECGAKEYHYTKAEYLYGMSFMQGIDVIQDINEGVIWLKKAANKNDPEALGELGYYYMSNNNMSLAEQYLLKSNQYGGNYAKLNLGILYRQKNDINLAETYYKQAISDGPKGQVRAAQELSQLYMSQNRITDGLWSLSKGANLGDAWCAGYLGSILYFFGAKCTNNPTEQDKREGLYWLNFAAQNGNPNAIHDLERINQTK